MVPSCSSLDGLPAEVLRGSWVDPCAALWVRLCDDLVRLSVGRGFVFRGCAGGKWGVVGVGVVFRGIMVSLGLLTLPRFPHVPVVLVWQLPRVR